MVENKSYAYKAYRSRTPKKKRPKKQYFSFTHENRKLSARITEINHTITALKDERTEIRKTLTKRRQLHNLGKIVNVKLYALKLENNKWYVGQTYNVEKRFKSHSTGRGASWTMLHRPIEIAEIRETEFLIQDDATALEDDMTLEYALKYGAENVRGGGYCQLNPLWPDIILQNEKPI